MGLTERHWFENEDVPENYEWALEDAVYNSRTNKKADMVEVVLPKEQEAVKPKSKVRHGANAQIQHFCGNCMTLLHGKPKYCSECGKKVYWHDD